MSASVLDGIVAAGRDDGRDRPKRALPRSLRLRTHGVTPLFLVTIVLLTLGAQLGGLAYVMLIMHIADGVSETRNGSTIAGFAVLFFVVMSTSAVLGAFRASLMAAVAERFGLRLRAEAMQAAIRRAVNEDPGEGVAVLRDIGQVEAFIRSPAAILAIEILGAMVPLGILFYFDRGLGLITVGGIVAAGLIGLLIHLATRGKMQEARKRLNDASADLGGQLVHPDLVRGLGMLWATMVRWQPRYDGALDTFEEVQDRRRAVEGVNELAMTVFEMVIKGWACWLLFQHIGTFGLLLIASVLSMQAISPFMTLARSWENWGFALQAWRRLREAITDDGEAAPRPADPTAPQGLVLQGTGFAPKGRPTPIIHDLTLRLPPGTAITVEGPNGVGKSTLLRLTLGLMAPTSGQVMLDGQDTYHCDRAEFGTRIGYLPQDVQLLEGSVFHNIGRGPDAPAEAVVRAARAAGAHELIGRLPLGYQTPAGGSSGLSAGQRRLIGLARALYGEPRLLVLDEPEVGLDGWARVAMRAAIAGVRERGGIVLIVTHEPDTWRGAVDLRLLLSAGGGWQVQPAHETIAGPDTARTDLATLR